MKGKRVGPSQNRGPLHTFLSPELTLEIPYVKLPVIRFQEGMMDLALSWNSKLVIRKWTVLLEERFGNQSQAIAVSDVLKEDHHLGIHLFGLLKMPFMRHLVFAWYFAWQHEYLVLNTTS